ncbi:MAG: DUF503 domain-containing protein [Sphaerobacter sp.]|nr:DUF503 domain-containing protein [Sphaerobacter sp.]
MVVGICRLTIELPAVHDLKQKRRVVRSITSRVRARFNVSIAEVDDQDMWQVATVAFVCLSNSSRHVDDTMHTVIRFIEGNLREGYLADVATEIMHLD